MITVKQLISDLQELIKLKPECENYQVIYSHDDEGNEYQRVINNPNLVQLENPYQKSYRFLELVDYYDDISLKDCNAVIIN
jgi:hypothetical protein